jgi:hypothetical protein
MTNHATVVGFRLKSIPPRLFALLAPLFVLWLLSSVPGLADTISLTAVEDTSLYQDNSQGNLGATTLLAGRNYRNSAGRAIFVFDLSGVPSGAIIDEASVSLAVTKKPDIDQHGGPIPSEFSIYRMLVSWGEGSGTAVTGSPAKFGEATWSSRFFPLVTWDSPGGSAGVDYVESPSSSTPVDDLGVYVFQSTPTLIDDVTTWLADPGTNFGFMLISANEFSPGTARRFSSTEQASAEFPAPTLTLVYTVPEPSSVLLAGIGLAALASRRQRRMARQGGPLT